MLVRVSVNGISRTLTYAVPDGTQVGDLVTVPAMGFDRPGTIHEGRVVALGSHYTGPVKDVLSVRPPR
jgi:hypothetical protein